MMMGLGTRKDVTRHACDLVSFVTETLSSHPDWLFLHGLLVNEIPSEGFQYFQQAKQASSTHPLLYYILGLSYSPFLSAKTTHRGNMTNQNDEDEEVKVRIRDGLSNALNYYSLAIQGNVSHCQ